MLGQCQAGDRPSATRLFIYGLFFFFIRGLFPVSICGPFILSIRDLLHPVDPWLAGPVVGNSKVNGASSLTWCNWLLQ